MQERDGCKKEISETLETIDVIQKQSLNIFDKPEVHNRVMQLLNVLDQQAHALNACFESPSPDENEHLQNLFFQVRKMKETSEKLKIDPHKLEAQQDFISAIDAIKQDLNNL